MNESFIICTDVHGDYGDQPTIQGLRTWVESDKKAVRFMLGDVWDFRPLRCKASEEERL